MRKNVASQNIALQMNSRTDGSPLTSAVSVLVTIDNGTQTAGGGTTTHKGNGHWNYAPTQAETNGNHIAFTGTHATGVVQTVQVYTISYDPHDTVDLGLTNLDATVSSRATPAQVQTELGTYGALKPTVASRTLDVTATGEAGIDLDNTAGTLAKGTDITGFNDLSAAQVNTEVDTAIADARLDELLAADSDIDGAAPPTVGSVFHELLTKTAGSFTYDQTTDSLEAVRDNTGTAGAGLTALGDVRVANLDATVSSRLATAGYTAPPTVGAISDQVWDEVLADHLTAGTTGAALNAAGAGGDPWSTALPGAYGAGTAGKIVGDNVNATISSRATQASVDLVKAQTDQLAFTVANQVDANTQSINDVTITGNGQVGTEFGV